MPRKSTATVPADVLSLSQQSNSSEDATQEFLDAMRDHLKQREIKKQDTTLARLLTATEQRVRQDLTASAETTQRTVESINAAYTTLVNACAASDDKVRTLWTQIAAAQGMLLTLAQQRLALHIAAGAEMEKGQIHGMALAKRACEDFATVEASLLE